VYLKINVPADSATNTFGPATQGADNSPNNNPTVALATSNPGSSPQDGPHLGSGTTEPLAEEGQTEMPSTEKALDDADQAANSMQPALDIAITTTNIITTASDAIDGVVSVYQTWEKAVATMEAVMVVVDKIAEVIAESFYLLVTKLNDFSDPPICEDGMERAFCYPQGMPAI
jgi:hypothetical protein